jgi:DNA polymerase-3 subunit epsilon
MKPLLYFDLETTGTDVTKDRIIELALVIEEGSETWGTTMRFNPGIPIPAEATETHGITDQMVAHCASFGDHAKSIHRMFQGCDIAGYNVAQFDIPLLWEEFHRAGVVWDLNGVNIIDACKIYREKEPRTLEAAAKYYLGEEHTEAHQAAGDVEMTRRVLTAQRARYEDLRTMDNAALAVFCGTHRNVDVAGKIVRNDDDVPCFAFGANKGVPINKNRNYAEWMLRSEFPNHTKMVLRKILYGGAK